MSEEQAALVRKQIILARAFAARLESGEHALEESVPDVLRMLADELETLLAPDHATER